MSNGMANTGWNGEEGIVMYFDMGAYMHESRTNSSSGKILNGKW